MLSSSVPENQRLQFATILAIHRRADSIRFVARLTEMLYANVYRTSRELLSVEDVILSVRSTPIVHEIGLVSIRNVSTLALAFADTELLAMRSTTVRSVHVQAT